MRFRYFHFYSFDNDDMKSSKRHVILLSLIFLLKLNFNLGKKSHTLLYILAFFRDIIA